jgi:hypothetical protein
MRQHELGLGVERRQQQAGHLPYDVDPDGDERQQPRDVAPRACRRPEVDLEGLLRTHGASHPDDEHEEAHAEPRRGREPEGHWGRQVTRWPSLSEGEKSMKLNWVPE